ncbi:MAG: peptidoglycan editing factor PgeF [Synergistaceae bacterium]|nr:peptidoglycan editing factor PgeF [Synergistaceae bacterium]
MTDLIRNFEEICKTKIASAGYTSGLCGEWTDERFEKLAELLGIDKAKIIVANEKHTDKIFVAKDFNDFKNLNQNFNEYFDAIITSEKGIALCVHTADCVPVALLDPVKKIIGIVHSGWRGSAQKIAGKTVRKMIEIYNSNPENIICSIGPYNRSCCYEVGEDVFIKFRENFSESECERLFQKTNDSEKFMLDLGAAVSISLFQEGIKAANIFDSGHCTYHNSIFSSWRRTRDAKKQMITYIILR